MFSDSFKDGAERVKNLQETCTKETRINIFYKHGFKGSCTVRRCDKKGSNFSQGLEILDLQQKTKEKP